MKHSLFLVLLALLAFGFFFGFWHDAHEIRQARVAQAQPSSKSLDKFANHLTYPHRSRDRNGSKLQEARRENETSHPRQVASTSQMWNPPKRAIVPTLRDAPTSNNPNGSSFTHALPLEQPRVSKPGRNTPALAPHDPLRGRCLGLARSEFAGKPSAPRPLRALLHTNSYDEQRGTRLSQRLRHETGMRRVQQVLNDVLFDGDCHGTGVASGPKSCLTAEVLGAIPERRALNDSFSPQDLEGISCILQNHWGRQNDTNDALKIEDRVRWYYKPTIPFIHMSSVFAICDFICNKPKHGGCNFHPAQVFNRSLICVNPDAFDLLEKMMPRLPHFFLITHHSDQAIYEPKHRSFAYHPKVLLWFGKGVLSVHPKLHNLPIGLEAHLLYPTARRLLQHMRLNAVSTPRNTLLFGFTLHQTAWPHDIQDWHWHTSRWTRHKRDQAKASVQANGFVWNKVKPEKYLAAIQQHQFVMSPSGMNPEAHRTWEILYMGRVPVVEDLPTTRLLEALPHVTVTDWKHLTGVMLKMQWERIQRSEFDMDKIWITWWWLHVLRLCLEVP